jgi:hypothetical protein
MKAETIFWIAEFILCFFLAYLLGKVSVYKKLSRRKSMPKGP